MKSGIAIVITGLVAGMVFGPASYAVTYDVSLDFSLVSNPNSVWSYGYSGTHGGELILYTDKGTSSGLEYWQNNLSSGAPSVAYNSTEGTLDFGTPVYGPGQIGFHPGPGGQVSVIRFTVPISGTYHLDASFIGMDKYGTITDVHVLINDVSIFDGTVNGFGLASETSTHSDLVLNANERVDFTVGFGNGNFQYDTTGIDAQLSINPCGDDLYPFPEGDITQDCYVNLPDLAEMAMRWETGSCDTYNQWCNGVDLSQNGDVGLEDLVIMAGVWLTCTDPFPPCEFVP